VKPMADRLKDLMDRMGGPQKPPARPPAKEVSHLHGAADQPGNAPPVVVQKNTDPTARTMLREESEMEDLFEMRSAHDEAVKAAGAGQAAEGRPTVAGNGKARARQDEGAKAKKGGKKETEDISDEIIRLKIFGTVESEIVKDALRKKTPELANVGIQKIYITLKVENRRFSVTKIESEPEGWDASDMLLNPLNMRLGQLDAAYSRHISEDAKFEETMDYVIDIPHRITAEQEVEVKRPSGRPTPDERKPKLVVVEPETGKTVPGYTADTKERPAPGIISVGGGPRDFYPFPDSDGYVFHSGDCEYLVRRESEDEFGFIISLHKRQKGTKEAEHVDDARFSKIRETEYAGFSDENLWLTVMKRKGEFVFRVDNWDPWNPQTDMPAANVHGEGLDSMLAAGIVTISGAATVFFLPQIASALRPYLNLMDIPKAVGMDLPIFGQVTMQVSHYLAAFAGMILSAGAVIMGTDASKSRAGKRGDNK